MEFILKSIVSPSLSFVQIVLVSYVGALIGEMQKEIDDDKAIVLHKFIISWISSGFGGFLIGLFLQGTIAQNNNYIVLGGAGATGYAGHKYSLGLTTKLLNNYIFSRVPSVNSNNDSNNRKKEDKQNNGG